MKVSVIGAGSWGSAFAIHLARKNIETHLWIREQDIYEQVCQIRENKTFLPGFLFPPNVCFHHDLEQALRDTSIIFIAIPSKFCRSIYRTISPLLKPEQMLVSLTKGIEEKSLKRMSEVHQELCPHHPEMMFAALSGPSFAKEVVQLHPTAVVVASMNLEAGKKIQKIVSSLSFRAYTSKDLIGVELAGALKNVIAIAAGISCGLEFGSNPVAALITRGLVEIMRLGHHLGAKQSTFSGLAGIGDLVLTCTGGLSRNRHVGYELGKGKNLDEILSKTQMVAEGIITTLSTYNLSQREGVEMPICDEVYQIIYKEKDPRKAIQDLMSRELKDEDVL